MTNQARPLQVLDGFNSAAIRAVNDPSLRGGTAEAFRRIHDAAPALTFEQAEFAICLSRWRFSKGAAAKGKTMYLRKIDGPRSVTLEDGSSMSQADLPPPDTLRWVASRKAAVVRGVAYGLLSRDEALDRYGLSIEEFDTWVRAVQSHGESGLKVTALQDFRNT